MNSARERGGPAAILVCAACHLTVNKNSVVKVDGKSYHRSCFTCSTCRIPLFSAGEQGYIKTITGKDGPFCQRCASAKGAGSYVPGRGQGQNRRKSLEAGGPTSLSNRRKSLDNGIRCVCVCVFSVFFISPLL